MATVTYKHQPAIEKTKGAVALAGNSHIYKVSKVLWPETVSAWIADRLLSPSLHVCCGKSTLGDLRLDRFEAAVDIRADASALPIGNARVKSVLCDPPYNGKFQWNHDLLSELARVAEQRIIFQHWFLPCDKLGRYRKLHAFKLIDLAVWNPKSYFGRVQVISVFERQ